MSLKLYYHPLSTYSRRVLIVLAEKQVPHELSIVDMPARRHREQPYLSLNPYGRVPTLQEDEFVLFESTAILNYLEATHPTPPLAPDVCYAPFLEFLPLMEIAPSTAIAAWSERVLARPSVVATRPDK